MSAGDDVQVHRGSCLCGTVRYEVRGRIGPAYYCHCSRCRKLTGSAFSANAVVDMDAFAILAGRDALNATTNDAGVSRHFCGACGSPIYVSQGRHMRLRLGTLDTAPDEVPSMHIFTGSKADWFAICDGLPQHAQARPA